MNPKLLEILRCPVDRKPLRLEVIEEGSKMLSGMESTFIKTAVLFSESGFFYPVIAGIPRLIVEAYSDYKDFLRRHLPDYTVRKKLLEERYGALIQHVQSKNNHTKKSFEQEWDLYNYESDKTWNLDSDGLLDRFCTETAESRETLNGKWILDAGCGNGHLNIEMAKAGMQVIGMDFSLSVVRAFHQNDQSNVHFIQADVEFPPLPFQFFDVVHSSGVLIHTQRTELSFSSLDPCVKPGGKFSVWAYKPRKDLIHNLMNHFRSFSSRLPVRMQYILYGCTLLPVGFIVKRLKGNSQNIREMMVDILDWCSPRYRWEHEKSEVETWFAKRNYPQVQLTDENMWGFNMTGQKSPESLPSSELI